MKSVSLSSNRRHPPSFGEEKTRSSDLSHNGKGMLVRAELAVLHRARSAGQLAVVVIRRERAQRSERNNLYFCSIENQWITRRWHWNFQSSVSTCPLLNVLNGFSDPENVFWRIEAITTLWCIFRQINACLVVGNLLSMPNNTGAENCWIFLKILIYRNIGPDLKTWRLW